ncbi:MULTISPECIES: hypothetical protein [unclassified Streptomyces]|uniref:hypothetical protein n=1 Tax=unclassified Streptomyces TaxID=2593676 RepID=UPI002E0F8458
MALLAALAGGFGGEAGRQAWTRLSALVRRPFQRSQDDSPSSPASLPSSGEAELVRLEEAPADPARAQALSTALAVRAVVDDDFATRLQDWHEQAKRVRTGDGEVNSTISGGSFSGPVLMGRDFSEITFPSPPPTAPGNGTAPPPTQG